MAWRGFLVAGLLAVSAQLACAQGNNSVTDFQASMPSEPPEFLLVLKVDNKTLIVDPETHDMPAFESAVDARYVQSIEMLTGEDALNRFGLKGRNGVIIIQFKPNYILPLGLEEAAREG